MIKFYLKDKEVKLGDRITYSYEKTLENGSILVLGECTLTESNLEYLVNKGVIQKKYQDDNSQAKLKINTDDVLNQKGVPTKEVIIHRIATRTGWKPQKVINYLYNLLAINPTVLFQTLLKEVAIVMDKKYPDHISNSENIWVINTLNGQAMKINKNCILSWNRFAAFRTKEEADLGCYAASKLMYKLNNENYGKPKNKECSCK